MAHNGWWGTMSYTRCAHVFCVCGLLLFVSLLYMICAEREARGGGKSSAILTEEGPHTHGNAARHVVDDLDQASFIRGGGDFGQDPPTQLWTHPPHF